MELDLSEEYEPEDTDDIPAAQDIPSDPNWEKDIELLLEYYDESQLLPTEQIVGTAKNPSRSPPVCDEERVSA